MQRLRMRSRLQDAGSCGCHSYPRSRSSTAGRPLRPSHVSGASDRAPSEAGAARPVGGKRPRRNGSRPYAPPAVELVRSIQGGTRAAGDPPPEACGLRGHGRPASLAVRHCGRARGLPSHARPPARSSAAASKLLMRVCPARWRATTRDDHIHPERCLWARASAIQSDRNAVVHRFGHRDRSG